MAIAEKFMQGPIPGAHHARNPRAKPWRKPPKYDKFDDALEYFIEDVFLQPQFLPSLIELTEAKMPLTTLINTVITAKMSKGLFTPDMALKLAGPVYKLTKNILDNFEVSYISGFEDQEEMLRKFGGEEPKMPKGTPLTPEQTQEIEAMSAEQEEPIPEGGLMGAPVNEEKMEIPMDEEELPPLMEDPTEEETV